MHKVSGLQPGRVSVLPSAGGNCVYQHIPDMALLARPGRIYWLGHSSGLRLCAGRGADEDVVADDAVV